MTLLRTEIEWPYSPPDFFEAPYNRSCDEYSLVIDAGRALVTLTAPSDPPALLDRIGTQVETILQLRQMQVHRQYTLEPPRIYQYDASGRKSVAVLVGGVMALGGVGAVDFIQKDAEGRVLKDTKAERIAEHSRFVDSMIPKVEASAFLRELLYSYSPAVDNPAHELVHLYEIRDALKKQFGGDAAAYKNLGISEKNWDRLGELANGPLEEGRHRGNHFFRRSNATSADLKEARTIAQDLIRRFASSI